MSSTKVITKTSSTTGEFSDENILKLTSLMIPLISYDQTGIYRMEVFAYDYRSRSKQGT